MSVYFIQSGDTDRVKIGFTEGNNANSRLASMQTGNPDELKIVCIIPDADQRFESHLHDLFNKHHVRGEWFTYSDEIRQFIEECSGKPFPEVAVIAGWDMMDRRKILSIDQVQERPMTRFRPVDLITIIRDHLVLNGIPLSEAHSRLRRWHNQDRIFAWHPHWLELSKDEQERFADSFLPKHRKAA